MDHKKVMFVALGVGAAVTAVGAALYTLMSYAVSGGDRTLRSVRFMERSGLEGFTYRHAQERSRKNA